MIQYWPPLTVSELGLRDAGSQTSSSSFWPIHNILARGARVSSPKRRVKYQLCNTETLLALHSTRSRVDAALTFLNGMSTTHPCKISWTSLQQQKKKACDAHACVSSDLVTFTHLGLAGKLQRIVSEQSRRLHPQQKPHPQPRPL